MLIYCPQKSSESRIGPVRNNDPSGANSFCACLHLFYNWTAIEHELWRKTLRGKLFLSPIEKLDHVLDIGTGTGEFSFTKRSDLHTTNH